MHILEFNRYFRLVFFFFQIEQFRSGVWTTKVIFFDQARPSAGSNQFDPAEISVYPFFSPNYHPFWPLQRSVFCLESLLSAGSNWFDPADSSHYPFLLLVSAPFWTGLIPYFLSQVTFLRRIELVRSGACFILWIGLAHFCAGSNRFKFILLF